MSDPPALAIVGSGSLARAVCYSLAAVAERPVDVMVVARSAASAREISYVAAVRASLAGRPVAFRPLAADLHRQDELADLFTRAQPVGVLLCASTQSPWEALTAPSPWTDLLARAGFGLALPLHAQLALVTGRAVAAACPEAWFVNACFPDAVNPLLAASGVPVLCGIGNVALLAASLQAAIGLPDQRRLQVLAHHAHLHAPAHPDDEALAWCDGEPVEAVAKLLAVQRAAARPELNQVTGHAAALLLRDLLAGAEVTTSLPGPLGLPGGYPVRLDGGRLALRLPPGVSETAAMAFNQRAALRDGVVVDGQHVEFGPSVQRELRILAPAVPSGFAVADVLAVADQLDRLRARLRASDVRSVRVEREERQR
jgi:hypothetical protein